MILPTPAGKPNGIRSTYFSAGPNITVDPRAAERPRVIVSVSRAG